MAEGPIDSFRQRAAGRANGVCAGYCRLASSNAGQFRLFSESDLQHTARVSRHVSSAMTTVNSNIVPGGYVIK